MAGVERVVYFQTSKARSLVSGRLWARALSQGFASGEAGDLGLEGALDVVQVVHLPLRGFGEIDEVSVGRQISLLHNGGGRDLEVHVAEQRSVVLVLVAVLGTRQGCCQSDDLRVPDAPDQLLQHHRPVVQKVVALV
jgi:hypothetical protein